MNEWSVCQMNADTKACMLLGRVLYIFEAIDAQTQFTKHAMEWIVLTKSNII